MVDIGLGPTDGFSYLSKLVRSWSPRRVQTDAYHRPCVLNYVPCAITSFFQIPAQRLEYFYYMRRMVSRQFAGNAARL